MCVSKPWRQSINLVIAILYSLLILLNQQVSSLVEPNEIPMVGCLFLNLMSPKSEFIYPNLR